MVIQCPECRTRFRLAHERMKPEGVKVRCARCLHVFQAGARDAGPSAAADLAPAPPEQAAAPFLGEAESAFRSDEEFRSSSAEEALPEESDAEDAFAQEEDDLSSFSPAENFSDAGQDSLDISDAFSGGEAAPAEDFPFEEEESDTLSAQDSFADAGEDDFLNVPDAFSESTNASAEEFSFDEEEPAPLSAQDPFADTAEQDDFLDVSAPFADAEGAPAEEDKDFAGEFDFGRETMEASTDGDEFDFGTEADDFSDFAFDEPASGEGDEFGFAPKSSDFGAVEESEFVFDDPALPPYALEEEEERDGDVPKREDNFGFGAMDFSTPPRAEAETPPSVPPAFSMPEPSGMDTTPSTPPPPVAAVPARKRSAMSAPLMLALLVLLLLLGLAGYVAWQGGPQEVVRLLDRVGVQEPPAAPPGQIRLNQLKGFFVQNEEAGQLFVISGQVVNEFREARSAIAVKGILYNVQGEALLQQTVFAGNPLSEEDLRTLSFATIQERMNNQFGESLSNLNIAPGKKIPFTIVFRDLPPDPAEFTVEVADSRPGAGQ